MTPALFYCIDNVLGFILSFNLDFKLVFIKI